jgi:hypothetical protein
MQQLTILVSIFIYFDIKYQAKKFIISTPKLDFEK